MTREQMFERPARARWPRAPLAGLAALLALAILCGCGGSSSPRTTASTASTAGAASTPPAGKATGLLARGSQLYQTDGCSACHSLNGTRIVGPTWKGLAGSRVKLTDGRTVVADDAYLTRHIVEPNAMTVQGYPGEVMAEAIQTLDLKAHPADVRALVAFIDSLR